MLLTSRAGGAGLVELGGLLCQRVGPLVAGQSTVGRSSELAADGVVGRGRLAAAGAVVQQMSSPSWLACAAGPASTVCSAALESRQMLMEIASG